MEILGPCPEAAVFHSACVLAEQVSTIDNVTLYDVICFEGIVLFIMLLIVLVCEEFSGVIMLQTLPYSRHVHGDSDIGSLASIRVLA